jgi:hypothetical protein
MNQGTKEEWQDTSKVYREFLILRQDRNPIRLRQGIQLGLAYHRRKNSKSIVAKRKTGDNSAYKLIASFSFE